MVALRPPQRLEERALHAWLKALNAATRRGEGVLAPLEVPPALLATALNRGAEGLREAAVARVAVAAVAAGVANLRVELQHPTLLAALLDALAARPAHLATLTLKLGPRTRLGPVMTQALAGMKALTCLSLRHAATDEHLAALASGQPPLRSLDVSYCPGVTDVGIGALLGQGPRALRELMRSEDVAGGAGAWLLTVSLWGTEVSSRGCLQLLVSCPALTTLTCRWAVEALDLLARGKRDGHFALTQLILAEAPLPTLGPLVALCPFLSDLVVRRPTEPLSVAAVLAAAPSLTTLTLVQFLAKVNDEWLPVSPWPSLTCLHLCLLEPRPLPLANLARTCPALVNLHLEGVLPSLPEPPPPPPQISQLQRVRLMTPPTLSHVLDPDLVLWLLQWAAVAHSIDLGACNLLTDDHLMLALADGAFLQAEDVRLSGAAEVSDDALQALVAACPRLRRLALKMLPRPRLAQLETLKVALRRQNLDVELITYGWKF